MRTTLGKVALLALMGAFVFAGPVATVAHAQTTQVAPANLTPEQSTLIANAIALAVGGDSTALATLIANNPTLATATGDAVASALNTGTGNSGNLSKALVATGNAGLVSGVLLAVNSSAQGL